MSIPEPTLAGISYSSPAPSWCLTGNFLYKLLSRCLPPTAPYSGGLCAFSPASHPCCLPLRGSLLPFNASRNVLLRAGTVRRCLHSLPAAVLTLRRWTVSGRITILPGAGTRVCGALGRALAGGAWRRGAGLVAGACSSLFTFCSFSLYAVYRATRVGRGTARRLLPSRALVRYAPYAARTRCAISVAFACKRVSSPATRAASSSLPGFGFRCWRGNSGAVYSLPMPLAPPSPLYWPLFLRVRLLYLLLPMVRLCVTALRGALSRLFIAGLFLSQDSDTLLGATRRVLQHYAGCLQARAPHHRTPLSRNPPCCTLPPPAVSPFLPDVIATSSSPSRETHG